LGGHLTLGPPKTPAAARDILLPPFLIELLRTHLDSHNNDHVFVGRDGGLHPRSSFHRRHWRPATDGNPAQGIPAVLRGLHFHDLRHSHKTWLIEDGVPEVAQAKRLGHRLPGGTRDLQPRQRRRRATPGRRTPSAMEATRAK
jgi:integrase